MATNHTPSTEPLRPIRAGEPPQQESILEQPIPLPPPEIQLQVPSPPAEGATSDPIPPQNTDGLTDERMPRSQNLSQNASANPSRAPSPNPSALLPHTQVTYDDPDFTHPPPLNYSLRTRKKALILFWSLIVVDCVFVPIALYFGLWYGTSLSPNAVFSISTGTLGTVSIVEYFIRFRRLWRKNSNCRVIGAKRFYVRIPHPHWHTQANSAIAGLVPLEYLGGMVLRHD